MLSTTDQEPPSGSERAGCHAAQASGQSTGLETVTVAQDLLAVFKSVSANSDCSGCGLLIFNLNQLASNLVRRCLSHRLIIHRFSFNETSGNTSRF